MRQAPRGIVLQMADFRSRAKSPQSCKHVNDDLVFHELESRHQVGVGGYDLEGFEKNTLRRLIAPLREHGEAKSPDEDIRIAAIVHCLKHGGLYNCLTHRSVLGVARKVWIKWWLEKGLNVLLGVPADSKSAKQHRAFMLEVAERMAVLLVSQEQAHKLQDMPFAA